MQRLPNSATDWTLYRTFLALASLHSTEAAARSLGISVPTLKRRLDRLESHLGQKLYSGYGLNFKLTEDGEGVANVLNGADTLLSSMIHLRAATTSSAKNVLRICVNGNGLRGFLSYFFRKFPHVLTEYRIDVDHGVHPEPGHKLKYDVVISPYDFEMIGGSTQLVGFNQLRFCATPPYIERLGLPDLNDLRRHCLVVPKLLIQMHEIWNSLAALEAECASSFKVQSVHESLFVINQGFGFGLVTEQAQTARHRVLEGFPSVEHPVYLGVGKEFLADASNAPLIELMTEQAQVFLTKQVDD